jgi:large subunit ribosomal protein L13
MRWPTTRADTPVMKTYSPKPGHIERRWYVIDAGDQVLGRLASETAALLRGKQKPIFAPHMDCGDHVIIVNADKVVLTGGKEMKKVSYRHSGYPGGIKGTRYDALLAERPVFAVEKAIKGMLPKNKLGHAMFRKLHVVAGPEHPHGPQKPEPYALGSTPPKWEGLPARKTRPEVLQEPAPKPAAKSKAATAPAKKATASKKSTAKKSTAPKAEKKTTTAKKSTAKKSTAKKKTEKEPAASEAAEKE